MHNKLAMGIVFSVIMVIVLLFMLPLISSLSTNSSIAALKDKLEQWGVYGYSIGALTDTRVPFVSAGNLADDADLTFTSGTNTLNVPTVNATTVGATTLNAPTGRGASIYIAANDATALEKAQADYVCDGTLLTGGDDVEINAAYHALYNNGTTQNGGSIYLSSGNFYINAEIDLDYSMGVTLQGVCMGGTTISVIPGANCNAFDYDGDVQVTYFPEIKRMTIYGYNNGAGANTSGTGIYVTYVINKGFNDFVLEDVFVTHFADHGLYMETTWGFRATRFISEYNASHAGSYYGVYLRGLSGSNAQLSQCKVNGNYNTGMFVSAPDVGISNSEFGENENLATVDQIGLYLSTSSCTGARITGCNFYGNSYGLYLYGAVNFNVVGCTFGSGARLNTTADVYCYATGTAGSIYDNRFNATTKVVNNAGDNVVFRNNIGYIAPGEMRTISKAITGGAQNTVTSIQNTFGGDVYIVRAYISLTAESADAPTYDMGTDDDGAGAPSVGNNLFEAVADTIGYYSSTVAASGGTQTVPIVWPTTGNDWVNFIITDANGAATAGRITIVVVGK